MATYYVNQDTGSDANGGTGTGDAWLTLDYAITQMVSGDLAWVTGDGTYTSTLLWPSNQYRFFGYDTTPGDNGRSTIRLGANVNLLDLNGKTANWLRNFLLDGDGFSGSAITGGGSATNSFANIEVMGFGGTGGVATGSLVSTSGHFADLYMHDNTRTGSMVSHAGTLSGFRCIDNSSAAYAAYAPSNNDWGIDNFLVANSGAVRIADFDDGGSLGNGVIYGASSNGVETRNIGPTPFTIQNVVIYNCGGFGVDNNYGAGFSRLPRLKNVFIGSCTSGLTNNVDDPVTELTADPFVDAANDDFNINDAAGGGALLRASSEAFNASTDFYPFRNFASDSFGGGGGSGGAAILGGTVLRG